MSNVRKKNISFILAIILFVSIIPNITLADTPFVYMVNGMIKMEFENKRAQTGTRFKTVGWIVHAEEGYGNAANTQKHGKMIGNDFQQKDEEETSPGIVTTYFEIKKDIVSQAFINGGLGGIPDGATVYLDSVFTVTHNGVSNGKYYYTLKDIQNAAPWGSQTMKDLENYFDIPITYDSGDYPLAQEFRVNGEIIDKKQLLEDKSGTVHNVIFPEKIVLKDGSEAILKESFEYYNFLRGVSNNKKAAPSQEAYIRPTTIIIGGTTSVGEYIKQPVVTVKHIDKDKNIILDEFSKEVDVGTIYKTSSKDFSPLSYIYSEVSYDKGKTWTQRSDKETRNIPITKDTMIKFDYSEQTEIRADLKISANPDKIPKDNTDTVKFILDSTSSMSKYPIVNYEFWFGESESDLTGSPHQTSKYPTIDITKYSVEPKSKWYGKVKITDTRGKQSVAIADITIGETSKAAEIKAAIDVQFYKSSSDSDNIYNLVDYINRIETVYKDDRFSASYYKPVTVIYLDKPNQEFFDIKDNAQYALSYDVEVDGRRSESTNGIGKTELFYSYGSSLEQMKIGEPYSAIFEKKGLDSDDVTWIWKQLETDHYDWVQEDFAVTAYDSVETTKKDTATHTVYFVGIPQNKEIAPPQVKLAINQPIFTQGETAIFTPTFYEEINKTYKILNKSWEIYSENGEFKETGEGTIPNEYTLTLAKGKYFARQYIYWKDVYENDMSSYAEVPFEVVGMRDPDVDIKSDKEKYYTPTTGFFTVNYDEVPKYTYHIDNREYKLKTADGTIIKEGTGTFPSEYYFAENLTSGFYTAEQTIYWWVEGEYKSKTAICKFKLISPIPSGEFEVSMKMSTKANDWKRIDVPGETGKEFKQIRIDLTPSIALNESLENPYPIDFSNPNTQIQIIPLTDDLQSDKTKNKVIHTPILSDKELVDNTITFKAKQYIDVRFDEPGRYRIKAKVANEKYVSQWIVRDIIIREDLPPKVDLRFGDIIVEENQYKVYRNTDDLRVRFKVYTTAISQDEDLINTDSAKLEFRFDYNNDNDTSNDSVHSAMYVTKKNSNLQSYVRIIPNLSMDEFNVELYSNTFPILGKMRFEYLIGETPTIPNFIGGDMPNIPNIIGSTYELPIEKKIILADNRPGTVKVEISKTSKIEINIIMGTDTLYFDLDTLKSYYGKDAKIYLIDKNGKKSLMN